MTRILVIGAGFGGMAAAIELKRRGFDDLTILDKGEDVGGVWRDNTYPGAACDVPTPYYSFSYEPNPRWQRRFAEQPDILGYLRRIADRYDLRRHLRLGTEVAGADWDEPTRTWQVRTTTGERLEADVLVPAVGLLSRPSWPTIQGLDDFTGTMFHSARWDHSVDLSGRRVAVIGTGASAVQFVPRIQPEVSHLDVFQRTPPYLVPRMDTAFTERHHQVFETLPWTQKGERGLWFGVTEAFGVSLLYSPLLARAATAYARRHMAKGVGHDAELFAKVWPSYPIGCKRVLFANEYLPALREPNVDLVTSGIERVTATGVRTADGVEHAADVIVLATGFTATDFLAPLAIRGEGGRDLRTQWSGGARAYLGMSVPHFPNMFVMYGPNTNLGSGSIIYMLESQARYVGRAVSWLAGQDGAAAVRPEVEQAYDDALQKRLVGGVWAQCSSWYRLPSGRIPTNWPYLPSEYRIKTSRFDPSAYQLR